MDLQELAAYARTAGFHQAVVGDYQGFYALSLIQSPVDDERFAIRLQVGDQAAGNFPDSVQVNGKAMPVLIQRAGRLPSC